MSKATIRNRLLDQGIRVLDADIRLMCGTERMVGHYLCPFCWRVLADKGDKCWTLEHIPIDAANGLRRVVICDECNSGTSAHDNETHYSKGAHDIISQEVLTIDENSPTVLFVNGFQFDKTNFRGTLTNTYREYNGRTDLAARSSYKSGILSLFTNYGFVAVGHPIIREAVAHILDGATLDFNLERAVVTKNRGNQPNRKTVIHKIVDGSLNSYLVELHESLIWLPGWGEQNIDYYLSSLSDPDFCLSQWIVDRRVISDELARYPEYRWDKGGCPLLINGQPLNDFVIEFG